MGLLITFLSLVPGNKLIDTNIRYLDIVVHFFMYFFWVLVYNFEAGKQFAGIKSRYMVNVCIALILYGGLMEIIQNNYIPGRYGSWSDFMANSIGGFVGVIGINIFHIKTKNK